MLEHLFIFCAALLAVIKGATYATTYAGRLAESFQLSKYTVGFIVVAVISILPETFIAINAAFEGVPAFGLGTLFGSNITDLSLIFGIIVLWAGRGLKIESKILRNGSVYPLLLLLPLVLGADGHYSRVEGIGLIIAGVAFYYSALRSGIDNRAPVSESNDQLKHFSLLALSMGMLLIGSHFVVTSATELARLIGVSPVYIGMFVVGVGTTMPELLFSLKSVRRRDDSLAAGDILGTVLADATIVVGILALARPFYFPQKIVYVTGMFMVVAAFLLFHFMRTGKTISRHEARLLILFWAAFVIVEVLASL